MVLKSQYMDELQDWINNMDELQDWINNNWLQLQVLVMAPQIQRNSYLHQI